MHKPKVARRKKFRILLDSAFAKTAAFPLLKRKTNLAHCVHELGLSYQAEDEEIYQTAVKENRFIITINFKDFKKLVKHGKPGIIGIESQLTNDQIDKKVTAFLVGKNPPDFLGKAIKIDI